MDRLDKFMQIMLPPLCRSNLFPAKNTEIPWPAAAPGPQPAVIYPKLAAQKRNKTADLRYQAGRLRHNVERFRYVTVRNPNMNRNTNGQLKQYKQKMPLKEIFLIQNQVFLYYPVLICSCKYKIISKNWNDSLKVIGILP
jgi:hypothetical protein